MLNEKQYRNIISEIEDGYYEVDITGNLSFFNDSLCKIYGYDRHELMGMNNRNYMTPETAKKAYLIFNSVYKTGEAAKIFDWEFLKKDGTKIDVEISVSLIKNSKGEGVGYRGIVRDIGERKLIEAALKKSKKELERRVVERTRDIIKINKQLEQEITEHKSTEKSLRESEAQIRFLADNISDVLWMMDMELRFTYASFSIQKLLGYTQEEALQLSLKEILMSESYEKGVQFITKAILEKGEANVSADISLTLQLEHVRKDGGTIWAEMTTSFTRDEKGLISGLIGVSRDITKRKQAEEELLKSETQLRTLVDTIPDLVWLKDLNGVYLSCNPIFEQFFGAKESVIVGKTDYDFVDKDLADFFREHDRRAMAAGKPSINEEWLTFADNGYKGLFETIKSPLSGTDGDLIGVLGIARDISERKNAENGLRESQKRYKSAQRMGHVGNWEYELVTENFWGSDETKRIYGFNPESKNFTTDEVEKCIPDRERVHQALIDLIENNTPYDLEFKIYPVSGPKQKFIRSIAELQKDDSGKPCKVTGVIQDITRQKEEESEKQQLELNLLQAQKMESIGTLTGGIAHDFNNILGIILGNTELALDDVPELNPAHSNLEEIKTASLRAKNIVKQLLSFSRKVEQRMQPIEIALVIKDALKFLRSTIPTTIDVKQDIKITDEKILADPAQINQIMMNLCINASHAMEETGGMIEVIVEKVMLDDNSAKIYPKLNPGEHLKIRLSDTGPGINPDIIDRVFDPYFTTKGVGKGSGMGLSVVHGIIKNHNGAITVDSKPGKGTTFNILFPKATEKSKMENESTKEPLCGNETILFVDDEISIVKMIKRMLERLGYKVKTKTNPVEALDLFKSKPDHFDLVITDMTMPQMTGVKLYEKLMGIRPDIPVIICTGHSSMIDEEKAKLLKIAAYVMKPITMTEISQTIRKVLDRK